MNDELIVRFSWGDHDLDDLRMFDGRRVTIESDGPAHYPLLEIDLSHNVLTIRPRCLMISASADSLRRYANILEAKFK